MRKWGNGEMGEWGNEEMGLSIRPISPKGDLRHSRTTSRYISPRRDTRGTSIRNKKSKINPRREWYLAGKLVFVDSRTVRVKYIAVGILVGALSGLLSAIFLFSLEALTLIFSENNWLLYFLPLGGLIIGGLYWKLGKSSDRGNDVIKDEVKFPFEKMPILMAPLVFISTLITHLFGGSAGREGTAVQMTTSVADQFSSVLKLKNEERPWLLRMAISGGFAAVFGTVMKSPITDAVIALEIFGVAISVCLIAYIIPKMFLSRLIK